jgi:lysophospholipase L1-like esterase
MPMLDSGFLRLAKSDLPPKITAWMIDVRGYRGFMFSVPALDASPNAQPTTAQPTTADLSQLHNAKIICDGNSLTQGMDRPATDYPQQLKQRLNDAGYAVQVVNLGVSVQTTAHMLNDAVRQVDRLYAPDRLNLLIAMEGGNHIYFGATPQVAYMTFAKYCMARREAGYQVIAIDTFPRANGYPPGYDRVDVYAADLLEYNRLIRGNWRDFADHYFDARLALPEFDLGSTYYLPDRIHPNAQGNARLAAKLAEFLIANLTGGLTQSAGQ